TSSRSFGVSLIDAPPWTRRTGAYCLILGRIPHARITAELPMTHTTVESGGTAVADALPSLEELWMPFTANRAFKRAPRMLVAAKDMHYTASDGRQILDGTAGLWCVNAGHCRDSITAAIRDQASIMDYAPPFQMGHPLAFELAQELARMLPEGIDHVFFGNSGSEAVDT